MKRLTERAGPNFPDPGDNSGQAPPGSNGPVTEPPAILEVAQRLSESPGLIRSLQLKRLLMYLVESVIQGDDTRFTESAIGTEVFHRVDFDPRVDTIVRAQMRRLRSKLDEYYATEGASEPFRIVLEKNSYRPSLQPNEAHVSAGADQARFRVPAFRRPFLLGAAIGALCCALIGGAGVLLFRPSAAKSIPAEVRNHPLWRGFASQQVVCGFGTMLFFRIASGFERDFRLNMPHDLQKAPEILSHSPVGPVWDRWSAAGDIITIARLDRMLAEMNSPLAVVPARDLGASSLMRRHAIILGHPRAAPLLLELLANEDFRVSATAPGVAMSGFVNVRPRPSEAHFYGETQSVVEALDESTPDWALITSLRPPGGGELLSVFGNRVQTNGFVVQKLLDPAGLDLLNAKVFNSGPPNYRSLQIVLRVDYNHSVPTGFVYVTHHYRQ